jgi:hypothetical protein
MGRMFVAFFLIRPGWGACSEFHPEEEKRQIRGRRRAFGIDREFLFGFAGFGMGRY